MTPAAEQIDDPVLLAELRPPRLGAYPVYKVTAEKLHASTTLGMLNSRWKEQPVRRQSSREHERHLPLP
jgi:hypothetical protein